nr:asparagine synthase (glutamine-hydrolyzing) [Halosimplex litoreum]
MTDRMTHRGPDASGIYANGPAVLAHCRLAILDPSPAGRQPMANTDDTVHIVFNGEIYNYRELRERVDDYRFQSETDTEVLLHLYEEYGTDCLQYLRGMFAFGIYDEERERLFLARDRLGQKPLYLSTEGDTTWFGSTIGAITSDESVPVEPDYDAIRQFLTYQYVPHPATGFEGIEQLRPAEYAVVNADGITREQYWSLSFTEQSSASPDRLADRLRSKLREVTRLRMRSDVPLGVFLSGGVDSSIVTALMSDIADDPVKTYSVGFDEAAYDELSHARTVSEAYGTDHHEYTATPDAAGVLPQLVAEYEMPFGDPSALPTYYVSQAASDDVTVVLGGDAGDENFAGYDRYWWDQIAGWLSQLPSPARRVGVGALDTTPSQFEHHPAIRYPKTLLETASRDPTGRYATFICHGLGEEVAAVWDGHGQRDEPVQDELAHLDQAFTAADGPTRLDRLLHVDFQTYLPDDLLVKVDRASMAHSLEVRSPFLDHELVEFAARIPAAQKRRRSSGKLILKRAFADTLPSSVTSRDKQGFSVPVDEWFRTELRGFARDRLDSLGRRDRFDGPGISRLFEDHLDGADHGFRLWDLVVLEEWFDQFIDPPL